MKNKKIKIFLYCIGFFLVLPLLISFKSIDPNLSIRFAFFSLFLELIILLILINDFNNYKLYPISTIVYPLLGFLVFSIISIKSSINIYESINEIVKLITFINFSILTSYLSNDSKFKFLISKSITVSIFILSLIGLIQYFTHTDFFPGGWGYPYSTMSNGNLFSSLLIIALPFTIFTFFISNHYFKNLASISIILINCLIIVSQTRSVYVAYFFIMITSFFYFIKNDKIKLICKNKIKSFLMITIIGLFMGSLLNIYGSKQDSFVDVVSSISELDNTSISYRLKMWDLSIKLIQENLIFGAGLGNWKIEIPKYGLSNLPGENGYNVPKTS